MFPYLVIDDGLLLIIARQAPNISGSFEFISNGESYNHSSIAIPDCQLVPYIEPTEEDEVNCRTKLAHKPDHFES